MTAERKYGQYIDKHDIVVRFNVLPVRGFEEFVGSKTSLRVVNHRRSVTACCRRGWPEPRDSNGTDTTAGIMTWFPNQVCGVGVAMGEELRSGLRVRGSVGL
jgi:hypothetical protein